MTVSTKLAAVVAGGLLLATAYAPAWAQSTASQAAAPSASAVVSSSAILGVIAPLINTNVKHGAEKNCKPDSLYSSHDVVGDSEACFVSRVDARTSATMGGGAVAF
jgi:hypothetical protein